MNQTTTTQGKIEHLGRGFHRAHLTINVKSTGTEHPVVIQWRNEKRECCGETLTVAGDQLPIITEVDYSHEVTRPMITAIAQCGRCGSVYQAGVYVKKEEAR